MGRGGRGSFVRYIVHGSRIGLDAPRKSGALYHRSLASNMARGDKFRETLTGASEKVSAASRPSATA